MRPPDAPPPRVGTGAGGQVIQDGDGATEDTAAHRHDRCTCGVGHPHQPPVTPDDWRHRHGPDLLDLTDTRRLNEITALKAGRRLCDLAVTS